MKDENVKTRIKTKIFICWCKIMLFTMGILCIQFIILCLFIEKYDKCCLYMWRNEGKFLIYHEGNGQAAKRGVSARQKNI